MKRLSVWLVLLLALVSLDAVAQTRAGLMKQLEGTMLLTGRIDVAADGSITSWSIDRQDEVSADVMAHIAHHVPLWQVLPATVDDQPVASSTRFSLRLVARPVDRSTFRFNIASVHIEEELEERARLKSRRFDPPTYPHRMLRMGATGTVYVLVQIDRSGAAIGSHVERVDLTVLAKDAQAVQIRRELGDAVMRAAQTWGYDVPTTGPDVRDDYYVVRVPVQFVIGDQTSRYGNWQVYLPGERTRAPWSKRDDGGNDAAVPGRVMLAGSGMKLLSPLEPGAM
ncbi:hypothetical protein [Luteimonas terricola]|uniref:Energy transducer TonB n=1 Tax=Luteimonas terricola TaxID=645597 RepID=A0ABQ2E5E5_9GAMM|nr:hypothetical protein [Luteimonas terricola]GGJ96798.1 hypothetical protein GCM10011394_02100 [Luteimonas terricola]